VNLEEIFRKLLGLDEPWIIREIRFDHKKKRVDIFIDFPRGLIPTSCMWDSLWSL
jgi:hypothetical protein